MSGARGSLLVERCSLNALGAEQRLVMLQFDFDMVVFREGEAYVAYCPELDLSSCGQNIDQARENLKTAVRLFVEEAEKMGTLDRILQEAE